MHQGADVGRPARGTERLLALGEERGVGGGTLLPLSRDAVLAKIASTRQTGSQAPQSTHSSGSV